MSSGRSERLTAQFYEWEKRCRGWHVFDAPIDLEPAYHPFFGHFDFEQDHVDDSKLPSFLGAIGSLFSIGGKRKEEPAEEQPYDQYMQEDDAPLYAIGISLPKDEKVACEDMEHLLLMLSNTQFPVSFEIVGTEAAISLQIVCREPDVSTVYSQVQAYFPAAILTDKTEDVHDILDSVPTIVTDLGLSDEFMLPLAMPAKFDPDPYIGLLATLEHLYREDKGIVQILFKGTVNAWAESIMRSVTDNKGGPFFTNAPDMLPATKEKVSAPLYAVCIRAIGQSNDPNRAIDISSRIASALIRISASKHNELMELPRNNYPIEDVISDVMHRQSHRLGMLLNGKELAGLAHFPTPDIATLKLERDRKKTQDAPESAYGHKFILGSNEHHGKKKLVSVPSSLRLRHTHVIGATGTGKSTMLLTMIAQDMMLGNGCAVLDPHGDLIEAILPYVPDDRIKDVILIDPADGEYPVAFNILSAHSEVEKDILSSDLVAAFKRLSTSWGDQMNSVFANAILAFLENPEGGTLADVRRFLIEKPYRENYLKGVSDPHIRYYWQHEYPLLKSSSIGSILTRLDTFLRPKLIRNMVAQKKGLDFEHILDCKKILLVKLSQGLMGAENSYLLGTFFVSKMYQAAMARQAKSKDSRSDFFLYIDEFQNFITPSMSYILSGARKYHLGLILAHQDMMQLQKFDSELASSVVVNAATRVCFRLGDTDAKRFASGFAHFEAEDLENLRIGEAVARIEQPNLDFNLASIPLYDISKEEAQATMQAVIEHSRVTYGTPRQLVEEGLQDIAPMPIEPKEEPQEPEAQPTVTQPPKPADPQPPPLPVQGVHKPASKVVTQHRYLQTLVKKMAQARGYKATIEELTPDGNGRVDVSLEKNGNRIGVEISVTTDDAWEIHNVEKCLLAGYETVIVCSNDAKNLERIKKHIQGKLSTVQQAKVLVFEAQELIQFLDAQAAKEHNEEKTVKGYRVKVNYTASSNEDMLTKQTSVIKAISTSIRKKK